MSIVKAIKRAFEYAKQKSHDKIYLAIDLHGVCFNSNYAQGGYTWCNNQVVPALQAISNRADTVIILFSSCHPEEQKTIIGFFAENNIRVHYFNENPECANTKSGCFDQKFYYSIIVEDKAGFDPDEWPMVAESFSNYNILPQQKFIE